MLYIYLVTTSCCSLFQTDNVCSCFIVCKTNFYSNRTRAIPISTLNPIYKVILKQYQRTVATVSARQLVSLITAGATYATPVVAIDRHSPDWLLSA